MKGAVDAEEAFDLDVVGDEVVVVVVGVLGLSESISESRLVVEASMDGAALFDWTLEPSIKLIPFSMLRPLSVIPGLVSDLSEGRGEV